MLGNSFTPSQISQSYLYPVDATASMDFIVGTAPASSGTQAPKPKVEVLGKRTGALPTTGAEDDMALAAVMLSVAAAGWLAFRRRHFS